MEEVGVDQVLDNGTTPEYQSSKIDFFCKLNIAWTQFILKLLEETEGRFEIWNLMRRARVFTQEYSLSFKWLELVLSIWIRLLFCALDVSAIGVKNVNASLMHRNQGGAERRKFPRPTIQIQNTVYTQT